MCCEQLANRIKGLRHQIELMQDQLDELENHTRTPAVNEEIQRLEDEINEMKKDVMRFNNQFKRNCQK